MTGAAAQAPSRGSSDPSVLRGNGADQRAWYEPLMDRGVVPDGALRWAIRRALRARLSREQLATPEAREAKLRAFAEELRRMPVAIEVDAANRQHYEVSARFMALCLGPRMKYSSCLWEDGTSTLAQAEEAMLALTCERARIQDGQEILELGCGWGSLTLWMAEKYPGAKITAVSNSRSQREFILMRARERGLREPEVITADMRDFAIARRFDRVVSVEMFEHMKNYAELHRRIAGMMREEALLFVHVFVHARAAYHFEPRDGWMGRYFFTGGTMPSDCLLPRFQDDLELVEQWRVLGTHYERTAEAWLANLDARRADAIVALTGVFGSEHARAWLFRWRVFFLACVELWGLDGGSQWMVSHYLFRGR